MSAHVWHPRSVLIEETERQLASSEPILFDDCDACAEKCDPLRQSKSLALVLWKKMVAVEFRQEGLYRSNTEAKACIRLYHLAVFCERVFLLEPTEEGLERAGNRALD